MLTLITSVGNAQSFDFDCGPVPLPDSFYLLDFESETILEDIITDVFFEDYGVSNHNWGLVIKFYYK